MNAQLDPRICAQCPSGPAPMTHPVCNRCVADIQSVEDRRIIADTLRDRLHYDGVDYTDAILYLILPNLLPTFDPATVKAGEA